MFRASKAVFANTPSSISSAAHHPRARLPRKPSKALGVAEKIVKDRNPAVSVGVASLERK
jgi:hypothetical protein